MSKKTVIFDFDGTIADTLSMMLEIGNEVLQEIGESPGTTKDLELLRGMTLKEGFAYLKIPIHMMPSLALRAKKRMAERIDELQACKGMPDVLSKLHEHDATIGLVTSNSKHNVTEFLKKYELYEYFSFIDASVSIFGKQRRIKQLLRKQRIRISDAVYVGDEVRDIDASKALGMDCISVTWGINNESILSSHKPTHIVSSAEQLEKVLFEHYV